MGSDRWCNQISHLLRFKHVATLVGLCVVVAIWAMFFRPQLFGGPITNIAVSGNSMLPTLASGDFLVVKRQNTYSIGDIVVYEIPPGEAGSGRQVVHRIVGRDEGRLVMKGDNNASVDPWRPTQEQIIGKKWVHIPNLAGILRYLREPIVLALAIAVTTMAILLVPSPNQSTASPVMKRRSLRSGTRKLSGCEPIPVTESSNRLDG